METKNWDMMSSKERGYYSRLDKFFRNGHVNIGEFVTGLNKIQDGVSLDKYLGSYKKY